MRKPAADTIRARERARLAFVAGRDGAAEARDFAQRTKWLYRKALSTPYGKAYRRELVISRLVFREYLRGGSMP